MISIGLYLVALNVCFSTITFNFKHTLVTYSLLDTTKVEDEGTSLATPSQYAYASFPVDVIVYFRMQPSILRFSCLPISRVECILRLPSVDLVFSSKRAEDDLYATSAHESISFSKPKGNFYLALYWLYFFKIYIADLLFYI